MHATTSPGIAAGIHSLPRFQRLPLPLKAILVGLGCGLVVWWVLDVIQTRALESIFTDHLRTQLDQKMIEGRIRFDQNVKRHARTIRLMALNRELANYLDGVDWNDENADLVRRYGRRNPPPWFPPVSKWRGLLSASNILLLDSTGRVRESYEIREGPYSNELREIDSLLLRNTQEQGYLTSIGGKPVLLATEPVADRVGRRRGYIMLVAPLDNQFLGASQNSLPISGAAVALLGGEEQSVLASSVPNMLKPGELLGEIRQDFLVTGRAFFDYGASDLRLQFVTMIPRDQVALINEQVLELERKQRVIAALVFILAFTLVIFVLSGRINQLLRRISSFSQRALGLEPQNARRGDQLALLEERIGQLTKEVLIARDTMRRHHEMELRESEDFKGAILEASLDCIISMDQEGRIVEFNKAAETALGYPRSSAIGRDFASLVFPSRLQNLYQHSLQGYATGKDTQLIGRRLEVSARRSDRSEFPVELAVSATQVGRQTIFTAYLHDITERKNSQDEILRLARFASENPSPVLRVNQDGTVNYANAAAAPLLTCWGCGVGDVLPEEWGATVRSAFDSGETREVELQAGDFIYALLLFPVTEFGDVNIYGRDVTETRRAEKEALQHQSELIHVCRLSNMGEMATGLAHELNQPLSAIVNYAQGSSRRMQSGTIDQKDLKFAFDQVSLQATRAGEIIRRLRQFVQKREADSVRVDVNQIVRDTTSFCEHDARKREVEVKLELAPGPLLVNVDLVQVEQVLMNLLRNSIDALQSIPGGAREIAIKTNTNNGMIQVSVADNGPGLDDDDLDQIFNPFYTTKKDGMGMGLPISKTIISAHGGELWVTRGSEGGATFSFTLPTVRKENGK